MVIVMSADYEFWKDRARSLYIITVVSLVFLLFEVGVSTHKLRQGLEYVVTGESGPARN